MRPRGAGLLRLYPRRWRDRYGDEMEAVLAARSPDVGARLDIARGALDAWLHPPSPSMVPTVAALLGGGIWSLAALASLAQPVPPDWPGYLAETLLPAAVAAAIMLVALVGTWLRLGDAAGRRGVVAIDLAIAGYLAWVLAFLGASVGLEYGAATAIAQTTAAAGTVLVALTLLRRGDGMVGALLVVAGCGLVVPSAWGWLATGIAWLVIGGVTLGESSRRSRNPTAGTT